MNLSSTAISVSLVCFAGFFDNLIQASESLNSTSNQLYRYSAEVEFRCSNWKENFEDAENNKTRPDSARPYLKGKFQIQGHLDTLVELNFRPERESQKSQTKVRTSEYSGAKVFKNYGTWLSYSEPDLKEGADIETTSKSERKIGPVSTSGLKIDKNVEIIMGMFVFNKPALSAEGASENKEDTKAVQKSGRVPSVLKYKIVSEEGPKTMLSVWHCQKIEAAG